MSVPEKLPEHLFWLVKTACRQELTAVPRLMTATNLNFYVLSWGFSFYATNDKTHAYERLERVWRAKNAQPVPEGAKTYEVPLTEPLSRCRSCGAGIYWGVTENGKKVPLNINTTSHFTTCPHAKQHSKGSQ